MWTCTACRLEFASPAEQKDHFRSDWHRYNLKRKVVELPPVTEDQFNLRMQKVMAEKQSQAENDPKQKQLKKKEEMAKTGAKIMTKCVACNKAFTTSNAYENHLLSKKHVANAKKNPQMGNAVETIRKTLEIVEVDAKTTKKSENEGDAEESGEQAAGEPTMSLEEYKKSIPLDKEDCIFCSHRATDLDSCLAHMLKEHGFFVPDVEFLVDLEGLVVYLAEKVKIGHFCLYCNGKGKTFRNHQDVQKHMTALSHCKLLYEENEDMEELLDFYDFSSQYKKKPKKAAITAVGEGAAADGGNGEENVQWETDSEASVDDDEEVVEEEDSDESEYESEDESVGISATGELVLANGRRIGQREFKRYYRQRFRPEDTRESVAAASKERLLLEYQLAGVDGQPGSSALSTAFVANFMKKRNNFAGGMSVLEIKRQNHQFRKHRERLDKRSHKLQKHPNRRDLVTV